MVSTPRNKAGQHAQAHEPAGFGNIERVHND